MLVASMLLGGALFAEAASFDRNPSGRTGIVSINDESCSSACGGRRDQVNINIPNSGDSEYVTVYTDFMSARGSDQTVYDARGRYDTRDTSNQSGSSYTFRATLSAPGTSSVSDGARVTGLPDSYKIEYVSGHIVNTHGGTNNGPNGPYTCNSAYDYEVGVRSSLFSGGQDLGNLTPDAGGWCAQGTIVVKYKITNTESNASYSWYTGPWGSWGSWGACRNNEVSRERTRTVECRDQNNNPVSSTNCSGSRPDSSETESRYQACDVAVNLSVATQAESDVTEDSARLNGYMSEGDDAEVWFAFTTSTNPQCSNSSQRKSVSGRYGSGDMFHAYAYGLNANTHYYYRACARDGSVIDEGSREDFYTEDGNNGGGSEYNWDPGEWSSWSSCRNGEETQTRNVVCRNNAGNAVSSSLCTGSRPDIKRTRSCGDSSNDDLSLDTKAPYDITRSSAELRGRVETGDVNDVDVFFVWGEDRSDVEDVDNENRYSDIYQNGKKLQKKRIRTDFDGNQNFSLDVDGLDADERIYYRICAEYEKSNGDDDIKCGDLEDFETKRDSSNNSEESDIDTLNPSSVSKTTASLCGRLNNDGGDSDLRTWIEYRRSGSGSFSSTTKRDRGETRYCEIVRNLKAGTRYEYRACSDDGCDSVVRFTTVKNSNPNPTEGPRVTTENAYGIRANSAVLPGFYVSNADRATVWFQYGRSQNLNKTTRTYEKYGGYGEFVHNFTGLKSNQLYCYRSVIKTSFGTDTGATKCFTTNRSGNVVPNPKPKVVVVEKDTEPEIDLEKLGLGLSLVRLEIDDDRETVTKGEQVTYEVSWENISQLDLEDIALNVTIPREMQITSTSRGRLDQDRNAIFYTIDNLDAGERGSMTVTGLVNNGTLGDALTAEANLAFDNPVNRAQENATDYDVDEYVVATALGTASVFGLSNIGFLGWLTILLGLMIVFLVARWLYLEREELRAQAYVNGYGRMPMMAPALQRYDYVPAPAAPVREARYVEPAPVAPTYQAPVVKDIPSAPVSPAAKTVSVKPQAAERTDYRPYRPNK